jgi:long-chain acyl-CoA synthetase
MTISQQSQLAPERPAVIMAETGATTSYRDLEDASRALAAAMIAWGLQPGERIAVFMENEPAFLTAVWAGLRAGLRVVPVNRYLKAPEVLYIVKDSDSKVLFASNALAEVAVEAARLLAGSVEHLLSAGGSIEGYRELGSVLREFAEVQPEERNVGAIMTYTAGSTGRPKGVHVDIPERRYSDGLGDSVDWIGPMLGFSPGDRFFIAAPLYHTAPLSVAVSVLATGGTLVLLARFDAAAALEHLQRYRVSHGYLVPTMMLRMLKLPEAQRADFDPSHTVAFLHTGEPCPVQVKRAMIDWWGPKFYDMYGASELPQGTVISSEEWLRKPGSVGRPFGCRVHILDDEGHELGPGQTGVIHLEAPESASIRYHKAPEKSAAMRNAHGWVTVGDIGYLDDEGFLFLTDRKSNMVISGGVNIYPRESEDVLLLHPEVLDAVCFGVPDPDMGERLVAVVVARDAEASGEALGERLIRHCRDQMANFKCPRQVFFEAELPRLPTGKIAKHEVRRALLARLEIR